MLPTSVFLEINLVIIIKQQFNFHQFPAGIICKL